MAIRPAQELLTSRANLTIIDIRSEAAYRQGHIEGAVLYSRADLSSCTTEEVAFYCATGGAARWAAARHEQRTGNSDTTYSLGSLDALVAANMTTVSGMPDSHEVHCAGASGSDSSGTDALLCIIVSLVAVLLVCSLAALCIRSRVSTSTRPALPSPQQRALEKAAEIEKTVDAVEAMPAVEAAPAPASEA